MKSLLIPTSVTSIGAGAFCASGLEEVQLPPNLLYINESLFSSCLNLKTIELPQSVTRIGRNAFMESGLLTISLPESLEEIGDGAFCRSGLEEVQLPPNLLYINENLFNHCLNLKTIELPQSVTRIGRSAFSGSGIISISLPESLEEIGEYAFWYCDNLESVWLPKSLKQIEDGAFWTYALRNIYCSGDEPASYLGNMYFTGNTYNGTLWVPEGAVDLYANTYPWSEFSNIKSYSFSSNVDSMEIPDSRADVEGAESYEVYSLDGLKINKSKDLLPSGVYIIRENGKTRKVVTD